MNRQYIVSAVSIVGAVALLVSGSYAFFNDIGTSSHNTFSVGTLDLQLKDDNETDKDTITTSFGGSLAPGACTQTQTVNLRNSGTIPANHAEISIANVVQDVNNDATPDIDSLLRIQLLSYDGTDISSKIADSNHNGFKDLSDWKDQPHAIDGLPLLDLNTYHPLQLITCLDASAGNAIQGDTVATTVQIILNQDSSQ